MSSINKYRLKASACIALCCSRRTYRRVVLLHKIHSRAGSRQPQIRGTSVKFWKEIITSRTAILKKPVGCRGLALLEGFGIVSASHDMTLKVWDFQGAVIADLIGHTAIVYSVATSASGLIASASEDSSARVWNHHGQCLAHIPHPGVLTSLNFLLITSYKLPCSSWDSFCVSLSLFMP